jgi:hypothetical protein
VACGVRRALRRQWAGIVAEERGGLLDVTPAEVGTIDRPTLLGHLIDAAHPAVLAFVDEVLTLKEEPSTA